MKLKNWVSNLLIATMIGTIITIHADSAAIQMIALIIMALDAYVYGKYSKYVDRR